jgi:GNAT superfamily N-acetyltransferase
MVLMNLSYKEASIKDSNEMAFLFERAEARRKQESIPLKLSHKEDALSFSKRIDKEGSWSRLVYYKNDLIAFIIGFPTFNVNSQKYLKDTEHLSHIMVDPLYWNNGIGGELLDWAKNFNKERGKRFIELWTEENNFASRHLYEKKGYELTGFKKKHEVLNESIIQYQIEL